MIKLSYTTMNALIHEPHTWLCKTKLRLKTISSDAMDKGRASHRIMQEHVSGKKLHDLLKDLPKFPLVEEVDFDEKTRITFPISKTYEFLGYADGLNPKEGHVLEGKFGKVWTAGEFARLPQWKLYSIGLPAYKKVYFLNAPFTDWNEDNVRIFTADFNQEAKEEAWKFINKAIDIIEHIYDQDLYPKHKSYFCYYDGCSFCPR